MFFRSYGCKGILCVRATTRVAPTSPPFRGAKGRGSFRIIAASIWGLSGRKLVGVSFNSSSVAEVARPSALRAAYEGAAAWNHSVLPPR